MKPPGDRAPSVEELPPTAPGRTPGVFRVFVRRNWEVAAPFELCVENQLDWTHFAYLHKKGIKKYELVYKQGRREIFLYKARALYPFPLYTDYLVFRNYEQEAGRYRNVYINVASGLATYLDARVVRNERTTSMVSDYVFELPWYWRYLPRLFLFIFRARMRGLAAEDDAMLADRERLGVDRKDCAPRVPERFDAFDDRFERGLPTAEVAYYDHYFQPEREGR